MDTSAATQIEQTPIEDRAFELQTAEVCRSLQAAIAGVVQRLRPSVKRASELRRLLDLGQKLSWSMFSIATAEDPGVIASLLPGKRGMDSFLDAAALHGAPAESIAAAREAFEKFEEVVARNAGSRDVFESMIAEMPGLSATAADLKHRRTAFRALGVLWGRQARVVCGARIVAPSATPGRLDTVFVTGMVGLHRTRRAGPLHTTEYRGRRPVTGDSTTPPPPEPLDPRETGPEAIGLLRDFCSQPVPQFRLRESHKGYRRHELVSTGLGAAAEVTYFTGVAGRADAPIPTDRAKADVFIVKAIDFPIETFFGDILLHKSLCGDMVPEASLYALPQDGAMEFREWDRLPLSEQPEDLGQGLYATRTPLIPHYPEVLAYALDRAGWNPEEFRVFRICIEFPLLSSRVVLRMK